MSLDTEVARTQAIFNNWFLPIGGGSNNHDVNVSLGAFKFNEGITGIASVDKTGGPRSHKQWDNRRICCLNGKHGINNSRKTFRA